MLASPLSILMNPSGHELMIILMVFSTDPAVREALQRAQILRDIHKDFQGRIISLITDEFKKIHDNLLTTEFPSKRTVDLFMSPLKLIVTSQESPRQEKTHVDVICNHFFNFHPYFKTRLKLLISNYPQFRKSFYKIRAQPTCEEVFADRSLTAQAQRLLAAFKDFGSLNDGIVHDAMDAIIFDKFEISDRVQIYRAVNAASSYVDLVSGLWLERIEKLQFSPLPLALVWEKLYPGLELELEDINILNFETQIFVQRE